MSAFRQDMPPPGGYQPIQIARKLPKQLTGYTCFAIYIGVSVAGFSHYYYVRSGKKLRLVEEYDSRIALEPLMYAERDRRYLKESRQIWESDKETPVEGPYFLRLLKKIRLPKYE